MSSDEELMIIYRDQGSAAAFRELFGRYETAIFRFLQSKGNSLGKSVIEDLFQKTWLKVHENRKSYDEKYKFSPWVYSIALNNLRDHLALYSVKNELSTDDLSYYGDTAVDEETRLDAKLSLERINSLSSELSQIQQQVLELIEIEDCEINEVAAKLSISQDAVRQHLSRAKKKLRELMQKGVTK